MDSQTTPIVSAIIVYLYWLVTEWVSLPPWNDVSAATTKEKLTATLVNVLPFGFLAGAVASNILLLEAPAILYGIVWFGLQLAHWWKPYLLGASPEQMQR